ncbi:MAG: IS66 family transposase [Candidatus Woesearchaeota archaeon]
MTNEKDKRIKELEEENERLKKENKELKQILTLFHNPHTPPSKQRLKRKTEDKIPKKIGAPKGHNGSTRDTPKPTKTETHKLGKKCPWCGGRITKLLEKFLERIIEECPEPQKAEVTKHLFEIGICRNCGEVIAESDVPDTGNLGKNLLSHVTLMKFEDRLPLRKVKRSLKRQHNITLSHPTVLDVTRRVSDKLRGKYKQIIYSIRRSRYVYTDQTEIKISKVAYQLWVFVTAKCTLFIIRKADYKGVLEDILGKRYGGVIVGDGLESYRQYTDKIQRCWAHSLRESADLAEKYDSAKGLHEGLKKLFEIVRSVNGKDPPRKRQKLYDKCIVEMQQWIDLANSYTELRDFGVKLTNGLKHWFTRIIYPFVEATNNIGERALRELVVIRKIIGSLRNMKGARIIETIMTMITTWRQRGLDTFSELRASI